MDETSKQKAPVKARYAAPFFVVLAVLTVISFIIPLRPVRSQSEKRNLAQFPEFSWEALTSGTYFDDITLWFSDTFPGREGWLELSSSVSELHGYSEISIQGDLPMSDQIPVIPDPTKPSTEPTQPTQTEPTEATEPTEESIVIQEVTQPTGEVEEWGGVNAGENAQIMYSGNTIQIGDTAFGYCIFNQYGSDLYAQTISDAAAALADKDVRVVSMPLPTSIGIMVEKEYQEKLGCAPQDEIINYMFSQMDDSVVKVNLYSTLVEHNDEYIYFRTDHHWTARGAYYAYVELCETLGYEAAPLDAFEERDMGTFAGGLYYGVAHTSKLRKDTVYAYMPQGDIELLICKDGKNGFDWPLLTDMSQKAENTKYMTFLAGDHAMCIVTNNSIPDGPSCVVVKDSYGNPLVTLLAQTYHKVYAIDYRSYYATSLTRFVVEHDIDDVILTNNLNAAQYAETCDGIRRVVG